MFSATKSFLLLCLVLFSSFGSAQETERENKMPKDDHYGIFEIGPYYPLAFGDNSANRAFQQKVGGQFVFMFNLFDSPFLLGFHVSVFGAKTTSKQAVGQYDSTTSTVIGPTIGYHILMQQKWRGTLRVGFGYVSHNNRSSNFKFNDEGSSLWLTPSLGYQFTKNFGLYFSASYRHDFLHIKAPKAVDSFLNQLDYVGLSLGVRIVI